jgi:hypothetical protein
MLLQDKTSNRIETATKCKVTLSLSVFSYRRNFPQTETDETENVIQV